MHTLLCSIADRLSSPENPAAAEGISSAEALELAELPASETLDLLTVASLVRARCKPDAAFTCGIINAKGLFVKEGSRIRRDHHGMGRYVLAEASESETDREISINEVDIDNFIRAKGAIFSAIDTLLKSVDMTVEGIDDVYVAGGIGSGINMKNAVNIGMFPDVELEKFHYIGNSSLAGAYAMVMSDEAAAKTAEVAANMTYLELSTYPGYMDSFVAACFLPHTDKRLFPHSVQEA